MKLLVVVGLLAVGGLLLPGCASLSSPRETDWEYVSSATTPEWRKQVIHYGEETTLFVSIVEDLLVYRWERKCPAGSENEKLVAVWPAGELLTTFAITCSGESEGVLVDKFANEKFTQKLPEAARAVLQNMRPPSHIKPKPKEWI